MLTFTLLGRVCFALASCCSSSILKLGFYWRHWEILETIKMCWKCSMEHCLSLVQEEEGTVPVEGFVRSFRAWL
jgi:hypothetical protein